LKWTKGLGVMICRVVSACLVKRVEFYSSEPYHLSEKRAWGEREQEQDEDEKI
jgi:hypothetical protein